MIRSQITRTFLPPASRILHPRPAFTLVELLVVITIIGILASLIVVAAVGALKTAQQARIKAELNQINDAFDEYKNKHTAYPPNCQNDGNAGPLDENAVLADLKRHLKQVAPRHREPESLLRALAGIQASEQGVTIHRFLNGGMTAGEAIVFWLGGFSSDPKFPISGEGGPSYRVRQDGEADNNKLDPISERTWVFPFEVTRLAPRAEGEEYFDGRFIEYTLTIPGQNNNAPQVRRINFWQYVPAKSTQPYLYFDTSRHPAGVANGSNLLGTFDPPAATQLTGLGPNGQGLHVHALKTRNDTTGTNIPCIKFINPDKFQVLHCGIDDAWGEEAFEQMSPHEVGTNNIDDYLIFPNGPFTGDVADTVVNFATQSRIEDAQPQ